MSISLIKTAIDGLYRVEQVKFIEFSDGASTVKIDEITEEYKFITVVVDSSTPCDKILWQLMLVRDAIARQYVGATKKPLVNLNIPYMPYARADRVFEVGNPLPLDLFFTQISKLFHKVITMDLHSDVISWGPLIEHKQCDIFRSFAVSNGLHKRRDWVLVAPDKGSTLKARNTQDIFNVPMVYGDKTRDISTGKITSIYIKEHDVDLVGKTTVIVDDICDGGGTFIPLAEELKEQGASEVWLFVTHGIFAKGLNIFKGKIDKIACGNNVSTYINATDIMNFNLKKDTR